jgi:hypothetical protein
MGVFTLADDAETAAKNQAMDLDIFRHIFGKQPTTYRFRVTLPMRVEDPENPRPTGIPIAVRGLLDSERLDLLHVMTQYKEPEADAQWIRQIMLRCIVEVDDMPFPMDRKAREDIIGNWPDVVSMEIGEGINEYYDYLRSLTVRLRDSPNQFGATDGPLFAPGESGATSN